MFRIKICGLTESAAVRAAASAGADALGFNFYTRSRRYLDAARAREVIAAAPSGVKRVGVFVNATSDEIKSLIEQHQLDIVQLHGDEPPEQLAELRGLPLVKVFRASPASVQPLIDYLLRCDELKAMPQMLMLDAAVQGEYGGSGQRADTSVVLALRALGITLPLVLAGGLTPENVAEAIRVARPDAVDVASGVEGPDGKKDPARVAAFVAAARSALGG